MWTSFTLASVYSVDEKIPQSIYKQCLLIVLEAIFSYLSTRISGLWLHCWLMVAPNQYGGGGGQEWCQLPGAAEWTKVGPGQCLPQHWPGFREGGRGGQGWHCQHRPSSRSLGYVGRAGTHSPAKINQHLASPSLQQGAGSRAGPSWLFTVTRMSFKDLTVAPCVKDGSNIAIIYYWWVHQAKECANKAESAIRKSLDRFETQYVLQPIYHLAISDQPFTFMHTYVIE